MFYSNNKPIRSITSLDNYIWLWKYNKNGKLKEKISFYESNPTLIHRKEIMSFKNDKLIKEEQYYSIYSSKEKQYNTTYRFKYNKQGLIIKVEKYNGEKFVLNREYCYYRR